ncbi:putative methylase [Methanolinea mesophila]|uniref:METTL5 family protein n=1 Tax=Methanolinea mesophila TaxID=547055 RepID=UPI001AEB41BD|nr:putative methylase [Methanolinea mesophila]
MKLRQLEMKLERLSGFSSPDPGKEQYRTPAPLAARLLFHAWSRGDIEGKKVIDLGCGTGVLSVGAALLGADEVTGIDIDPAALEVAERNATGAGVTVGLVRGDLADPAVVAGLPPGDTVVMNPPFGAQTLHADRPFIDAALRLAPVTYGIFNAGSRSFLTSYLQGRGVVDEVVAGVIPIKKTFAFHTREVREIPVEIMVLRRVM